MARNTAAIAARDQAEANLLQLLQNLAAAETALAIDEASWLVTPIADRSVGGLDGNESISYGAYLGYWNNRRNSIINSIEGLERLIEALNKRIQAQQPYMVTQHIKVKY